MEQNTRINLKEGKRLRFKEQKREVFVGSLKCEVDKETESVLRSMLPLFKRDMGDGRIFYHFPDGHVETTTKAEIMRKKADEVTRRWRNGDRGRT